MWFVAFPFLTSAQTTTLFTVSTNIASTNASFDGQNIVVSNCIVTINGEHSFANVQTLTNAVLNYASATNVSVQSITVDESSTVFLCGGLTFNVAGSVVVTNSSTIICQGTNVTAAISNQWVGAGVIISAGNISVAQGAAISADGQGYASGGSAGGAGPGGGEFGTGGGSYGGLGSGPSGPIYGNALTPLDLGSAGWANSQGGGAIQLTVAGNLVLNGRISANGSGTSDGGSGGSVYVVTGGLVGSGPIQADGVSRNCQGGGGRIAVYYNNGSGYTGYTNCVASAGGSSAQNGTVVFFDTSIPNSGLHVFQQMVYSMNSNLHFGSVTLATNSTLTIGGGSTLVIDGLLNVESNATLLCEGLNTTTTNESGKWAGVGITLTVSNMNVNVGGAISADGQGYASGGSAGGAGPGGGRGGAGGGSYGGLGSGPSGPIYGSALTPIDLGSAGWASSQGGGAIKLNISGSLTLNGRISANGSGSADGGSGGSVYIIAQSLVGAGVIQANGVSRNCQGGGGRVAVYYNDGSGYTGYANCTASPGGGSAQAGTVIFIDTSVPNDNLFVFQQMVYPQNSALHFASVTLGTNASLTLGGASTMQVDGAMTLSSNATLLCQGTNNTTTNSSGQWVGVGVSITASSLTVAPGAALTADGQGYASFSNGGTGPGGGEGGRGAGSYGGTGSGPSGPTYGNAFAPIDLGSAGWVQSEGGGAIQLNLGSLVVNGRISANGGLGTDGGSGGSIYITTGTLAGNGDISADGSSQNCNGGGGRIAVYYEDASAFSNFTNITADPAGSGAQPGSVILVDRTITNGLSLQVRGNLVFPQNSQLQYASLTLTSNALLTLGGNSVLDVTGQLTVTDTATLICQSINNIEPVSNHWIGSGVTITASNLTVTAGGSINADGQGYSTAVGGGAGPGGGEGGFGGGSYGGAGSGPSGPTYGNAFAPTDLGSSGWSASEGGGAITINVRGNLDIDGSITANGSGSSDGGSGGSIFVTTGGLSGNGIIAANGASRNCNGGGGRVAVYYENLSGFATITNITADAAGTGALDGSVILIDRTVTNGLAAQVYHRLTVAPGGQLNYQSLFLAANGTLTLEGGSSLQVAGQLTISSNATVICEGTNISAQVNSNWAGVGVSISASNLTLVASATITADGQGYSSGGGGGTGPGGGQGGFGGGSYGGKGSGPSGPTYGSSVRPLDLGSAGWANSSGGGAIKITASGAFVLDGLITANGAGSSDGGSGGSVFIVASQLSGAGSVTANGVSRNCQGGGGRVAIYTGDIFGFGSFTNVTATSGGSISQNGTVNLSTQPAQWPSNATTIFHGAMPIVWEPLAADFPSYGVSITASSGGKSYVVGSGSATGSIIWDTTAVPNAVYQLTAVFTGPSGKIVGDISETVLVNNSLVWHEGTLTGNQTWGTNQINAVDQTIIVPSGVTLTISPGAIVKFAPGTGIVVEPGGTLNASGATGGTPIIFTSLADDSAGGDSNEDGAASIGASGNWNGVTGGGQISVNPFVQVRFVLQAISGTLNASEELLGTSEYLVSGNIVVPTNVTLTIDAGAILKFGLGFNLTVEAGGTLIAKGTVAEPIVFTSINDGSVGASTNTAVTTPAAGDWDSIYLNGGQAIFDHVYMSYGGGPNNLDSGLISLIAPGSTASVSDSILTQSFYRGIEAEYGSINITNCVVTGCDRGIQAGLSGPTDVNIINCTVDNNNIGLFAHGGVMNVANTIVSDSLQSGVEYCCGSGLATFEYSDVWAANGQNYIGVPDQTGVNGNISSNPKFVNVSQGNYELNYGSPAINSADGAVAPPADLLGVPPYNYPALLVKTGVTNSQGLYPDMGAYEFSQGAPSPIDLIATGVIGPTQLAANQTVTVQWNDVNVGSASAKGPWHDTISLVPQNGGASITVATLLEGPNILGPGQTFATVASVVVPGGLDGPYQWQVQVNSQGDVFEGSNWTNNTTTQITVSTLTVPNLASGAAVTNGLAVAGEYVMYAFTAPSNGNFTINLNRSGGTAGLVIYIGQGYAPSAQHFDSSIIGGSSSSLSALIDNASSQPYYIAIYSQTAGGEGTFTLDAAPLTLSLNSVSPASVGNAGPATLAISGGQLTAQMTYQLVDPQGGLHAAISVSVVNASLVDATFDFTGLPQGVYKLQINSGAVSLPNAVTVNSTPPGNLILSITGPSVQRPGRSSILTVTYTNAGGSDMTSPILFLKADNGQFRLPGQTSWVPTQYQLLAINTSGGPAGVLPPGYNGQLQVEFAQLNLAPGGTSHYSVSIADPSTNLDWASMEHQIEPRFQPDDSWAVIFTNFLQKVGNTYGQYQNVLASDATYLGQQGKLVADVPSLLSFELQQADNFGVITKRYHLGSLGRNFTDPINTTATPDSVGNVIIQSSSNIRFFALQGDGSYVGQPGDNATVTKVNGTYQVREVSGITTTFNANGSLNYIADGVNRITAGYSGASVTSLTDSFGNVTTFTYNSNGRMAQAVDPVGRTTTYTYDGSGEHLLSMASPSGATSFTWVTNQGSAAQHALSSITYPDGSHSFYQYDSLGRMTNQTTDGGAEQIKYTYDSEGSQTATDATGHAATVQVDQFQNHTTAQDPAGRATTIVYDTNHQAISIQQSAGVNWSLTRDNLGNPVTVVDPLGHQTAVSYQSSYNKVKALTDPEGHQISRTYDGSGNMTSETYPDGSTSTFQWNPFGNLISKTDRKGLATQLTYDNHNSLTNETLADDTKVSYTYDSHRNLASFTDSTGTTSYTYDAGDRITGVTYPNALSLQFTYNAAGQRVQMTGQDGFTINYSYNGAGRLSALSNAANALIVRYTYDPSGRLARKDFGNGGATIQTFSPAGYLQSITNLGVGGSVVSRYDYAYDNLGRVTNAATLAGSFLYSYDADNQLTSVTTPTGRAITYDYDDAGNRILATDSGTNLDFVVGDLNQYLTAGGASYTYDAGGNVVSKTDVTGTTTYTYDAQNHMTGFTSPVGTWTYQYNALWQRTGVTANGQQTHYVIDPVGLGNIVAEYTGGSVAHYTYGVDLSSRVDGGGNSDYYAFDGSGNTANLTDSTGNSVASYSYLPFGEKLQFSGTVPNPFTYVGQSGVMDDGEGIYLMRNRWYDPALGHFTQPDPADLGGESVNLYEYAANNPTHLSDPNGLGLVATIIGLVTGLPVNEAINTANQGVAAGNANRTAQGVDYSDPNADLSGISSGTAGGNISGALQSTGHLTMSGASSAASGGIGAAENAPGITTPLGATGAGINAAENQMMPPAPSDSPFGPAASRFQGPGNSGGNFSLPPGSGAGSHGPSSGSGNGVPPGNGGPGGNGNGGTPSGGGHNGSNGNINYPNSGDPNDKVTSGFGTQGYVTSSGSIFYTIDFANETNAAAPAAQVVVTDQLDTNLDWSTFSFQAIAFNNANISIPNAVQSFATMSAVSTDPTPVKVTATFNPATGIATWVMESIDPVTQTIPANPLAGFLPPDNAQGQGEGFLTYTVNTKPGLLSGTRITNQAVVVFDVNAPIATAITTNTIDSTAPTSAIGHLSAVSPLTFTVLWSGSDSGPGIAGYDIYVSTNNGPWTAWLVGTTNTSAQFTGVNGISYAFYSVAYDDVGEVEAAPIIPGATTVASSGGVVSVPIGIAKAGNGSLTLTWSSGKLLQATNLAGPWTTNVVASPYTVAPTNSQMYFELIEN